MKNMSFYIFALNRLRMGTDGEGVTTLVALSDCPLCCRYCINPSARDYTIKVWQYSADELIDKLKVDHLYFAATGGGVTFGGGEPLMQAEAIKAFADAKPKEWKLNVETSLNVPEEAVKLLLDCVDEWIVDIKDMNPEIYERYTGCDNRQVLKNLMLLHGKNVRVRVPQIPGYNTESDVELSESQIRNAGFENIDRFVYKV